MLDRTEGEDEDDRGDEHCPEGLPVAKESKSNIAVIRASINRVLWGNRTDPLSWHTRVVAYFLRTGKILHDIFLDEGQVAEEQAKEGASELGTDHEESDKSVAAEILLRNVDSDRDGRVEVAPTDVPSDAHHGEGDDAC